MDIENLTLNGRMAYGIRCFITLCKNKKANAEQLSVILNKLCNFTISDDLSQWESEVIPLSPECIFEAIDKHGNSECRATRCYAYDVNDLGIFCKLSKTCQLVTKTKRNDEEYKAYTAYMNLDDELLFIIQAICDIGRSELYGTPTDCKESEILVSNILDILQKNSVDAPPIREFGVQVLNKPKQFTDFYGTKFNCAYILHSDTEGIDIK